jgi:hypothetical protein
LTFRILFSLDIGQKKAEGIIYDDDDDDDENPTDDNKDDSKSNENQPSIVAKSTGFQDCDSYRISND